MLHNPSYDFNDALIPDRRDVLGAARAEIPGRVISVVTPTTPSFDDATASRFARVALDNVVREFPNKLDHLMAGADDVRGPADLHPVFYGSYDWHSAVHMHWTLVTLLLHRPALPEAAEIVARLDAHFTSERIAGELAYLARPASVSFERPYGWAWLLKLCAGLQALATQDPRAVAWRDRMQPLADVFVARIEHWLPRAVHPSRAGSHANGAFALTLMLDYATTMGASALRDALLAKARAWYGEDRDYPVRYETSSEDFLSNGLLEAMLMHRVLCIDGRRHAARPTTATRPRTGKRSFIAGGKASFRTSQTSCTG